MPRSDLKSRTFPDLGTEKNVEDISISTASDDKRETWNNKADFLLSCIGYAVGLGNVWRFPYLCFKNGGASFLLPYIIMLVIAGMPLFIFELCFGQFAGLGALSIWKVAPLFKGIGYCMLMISFIVGIYYNVIIAWSLHYLASSFNTELPWASCSKPWNDQLCLTADSNRSKFSQSAAEQYWERQVLGLTSSDGVQRTIDQVGSVQWQMALALLFAWLLIFVCLVRGIKVVGKVVYVTATFPYVVLIALFVFGLTLDGSLNGIKYYLLPNFSKIYNARVWTDAASQIFYSLGVGFGSLGTMASYNKFNNNCYRDALIVSVINCGTSVFAGFIVFSVVGFMSVQVGLPIDEVIKSGPGLAFVVYPEGIARMPWPAFWSILFFCMLITLGLDSQFGMCENVISGLADEYPSLLNNKTRKALLVATLCIASYLIGLLLITQSGIYFFTLFDNYGGTYALLVVAEVELLVICYIYGYKNFIADIKMMLNKKMELYWILCWMIFCPLVVTAILIFQIFQWTPSHYGKYQLPRWADGIGFLLALSSIMCIPSYAVYSLLQAKHFSTMLQPTNSWGPLDKKYWELDERYSKKLCIFE